MLDNIFIKISKGSFVVYLLWFAWTFSGVIWEVAQETDIFWSFMEIWFLGSLFIAGISAALGVVYDLGRKKGEAKDRGEVIDDNA